MANNLDGDFSRLSVFLENDLSLGFNELENMSASFPELIYDGPFSDGNKNREIKGLTGEEISKETAKEKYQFRDSTGAIIIEIDNDDWNGLTVTPADTVTIYGEVDKEIMHSPEIDVDRIEKK